MQVNLVLGGGKKGVGMHELPLQAVQTEAVAECDIEEGFEVLI